MGLINRAFGLAEFSTYHFLLENLGSEYEDSTLIAIVLGVTGALAFSEFISRTFFNQSTYSMQRDFLNHNNEEKYEEGDCLHLEQIEKTTSEINY